MPPYPPPVAPHASAGRKNTLGTIALIVGIAGSVLACVPTTLTVGWYVLPVAFVLGIVGLLQSGKAKKSSVAAIVVAVVGAVVSASIVVGTVSELLFRIVFAGLLNDHP